MKKLCAIAALAVLLVTGLAWSRRAQPVTIPSTPYAFDICVAQAAKPATRPVWNDAVLSAVARTLAPTERGTLEEALGTAAIRWEANANPMLEDLEGGDPDAALITWFKTAPTFVRTAQAARILRTCAPDGFCATPRTLGASCPDGSVAPKSADEAERARFILWTWGHALRFRAASPELARAAAATLREAVPSSRVLAIVMTSEDADVTKAAPFATMRRRWEKVGGLKAAAQRQHGPASGATFAIDQRADEVIVLPRLDAIATGAPDAAIIAEVTKLASQLRSQQ